MDPGLYWPGFFCDRFAVGDRVENVSQNLPLKWDVVSS